MPLASMRYWRSGARAPGKVDVGRGHAATIPTLSRLPCRRGFPLYDASTMPGCDAAVGMRTLAAIVARGGAAGRRACCRRGRRRSQRRRCRRSRRRRTVPTTLAHDDDRSRGSTRSSPATRCSRSPPPSGCRSRRSWRRTASTDPNKIFAGQILELPLAVGDRRHVAAAPTTIAAVRPHCPPSRRSLRRLAPRDRRSGRRSDHWSVKIPLDTPHPRLAQLAERGFVVLRDADFEVPEREYQALEYMDWKSGGDTNFAPIASADGELDCRGFWDKGKTDKDALWTSNAELVPTIRRYVDGVGANFGRVRVIKLEPQSARRGDPLDPPRRQQPLQPRATRVGSCAPGSS